jgi:hypothetical protein
MTGSSLKNTRWMLLFLIILLPVSLFGQQKVDATAEFTTLKDIPGTRLEIVFHKGLEHYYPLMAIWVEDMQGQYMHPLYVAESMAKGVFRHARYEDQTWKPGETNVPSALPYWGHRRSQKHPDSLYLPTPEHPLPDAYTGATPTGDFLLKTTVADSVGSRFKILFEMNQSWDWNEYWYNSKYPGNEEYMKSAQPALVYAAVVDGTSPDHTYRMKPVGHSHPYGATGELNKDLSTLTTALQIADRIEVRVLGRVKTE